MESPRDSLAEELAPVPSNGGGAKSYRVGTLRYTTRGVAVLLLWLLWGDLALSFFETIWGKFFSIYLKDLHASNTLIGIMAGTLPGLANLLFLPGISQWSDRTRSKWGRRIPFLYVSAPLTVISLTAVGFAPEISTWLLTHGVHAISKTNFTLILLCGFVAAYHFFNMVLVSAYNWLLRDVVPDELMARFLSWFRIVAMGSTFFFLWFVFPVILVHRKEVFLYVGIFYLVAFFMMCLKVKEGEGPPLADSEARSGIFKSYLLYFRECLCLPIYRNFFIAYILTILGICCANTFLPLFTHDTLGLTMDTLGKTFAVGSGVSAVMYFPMGWLCDRFSSLRVTLYSLIGFTAGSVLAYFWVHGRESLFVYTVIFAVPSVGWALGWLATGMKLFPGEKFGQFFSALNVLGCGSLILGSYLFGKGMDLIHSDYRMFYLWSAILYAAAIYPMMLVYRDWKRHGGPDNYMAPLPLAYSSQGHFEPLSVQDAVISEKA